MSGLRLERTVGFGIILTLAIQSAGALMWGGAAEVRLQNLEKSETARLLISERMARIEEQMTMARQSLSRIEHRLDNPSQEQNR